MGKTVPKVLSTARGRRPLVVLKTEGTVFPNTDRPRPANTGGVNSKKGCFGRNTKFFRNLKILLGIGSLGKFSGKHKVMKLKLREF